MAMQEDQQKTNTLVLPSDEMAFRKVYRPFLETGNVTTVFRPGRRYCNDWRGYCEGQIVKAKVLEKPGADWACVPPQFEDGFERRIKITSIVAKSIGDFSDSDFEGSTPDVYDLESLRYHVGLIYNLSLRDMNDDFLVSRIAFEFIDNITH